MPTVGTTSKPAYVYDAGSDTWIPIGPGEHTHSYIPNNLTTTTGDIIYASGANTPARLGIGSSGNVLTVSGGIPSWAAPASGLTFQNVYDGTERTTTSTSFTSLGSSSSVTITTGTKALILWGGQVRYYTGAMTFDISGATTSAGDDSRAFFVSTNEIGQGSRHFVVTDLTAGSNTFTLKYRSVSGNNVQFTRTNLTVIDLGS